MQGVGFPTSISNKISSGPEQPWGRKFFKKFFGGSMPLPDNLFGSSVNDFNGWGPLEGFSMSESSIAKSLPNVN